MSKVAFKWGNRGISQVKGGHLTKFLFIRGRHFKNTNENNVCRGGCDVSSTEELGLQMFKEVMRGLDPTLLLEVSPWQFGRLDKDGSIPIWISLKVEVA